jgi:uncharacterized repeat protein (TIGR01451 family)
MAAALYRQLAKSYCHVTRLSIVVAVFALIMLATMPTAQAAFNSTTPRGSFAGNINYLATGGTLRTLPDGNPGDSCQVTNSNSATLSGIPAGSTIVAAYLYWGGSGATIDSNVTLNGTNVTADATYTDTFNQAGYDLTFFGGYKDVTSLVTGNGIYTFSNLTVQTTDGGGAGQTYCTSSAVQAGWALIVVYSNPSENNRVINIYDGIKYFYGSAVTTTPTNFQIPTSPMDGKTTVVTWEGDQGNSGTNGGYSEQLTFNGNSLTDTCNPTGNLYNSTINTQTCTGNAATDDVYYGVDIDTYNVSSYLTAGQTSANLVYSSGADLVFLAAQVISTTNTPVADLSITKSHAGNFTVGTNGSYSIVVHNNGPAAATGTTTVTDTLPTGLTYVSGTGTGWSCGAVGQNVTCTNANSIANGISLATLTLTVAVSSSAANPTNNTATVSNPTFDNVSANNSSTDTATVLKPDLSTSTKDVVDTNGGDSNPGDTLEYTITLNETGGVVANGVSVTDDMPAGITGLTLISKPAGSTDSWASTGGTNGTGYLNVTGISVPANGSATIVYDVTVAATDAPGDTIDNTATITNPNGPGATPAAPTVTVSQSQVPASGNKLLYVYDDASMTRTPQTGTGTGAVTINQTAANNWTLTTPLQKPLTLIANSTVSVTLNVECTSIRFGNCRNGGNLHWNAALYDNTVSGGTQIGSTSPDASFNDTNYTQETANIAIGAADVTVAAGHKLILEITNDSGSNRAMRIEQYNGGDLSIVSLDVSTVINVDSVNVYSATYPSTSTQSVYETNQTVYIRAVVSDPFGSADIDPATGGTAPTLTLDDANGTSQLSAVNLTQVADSGAATKTFEYSYTLPSSPPSTLALGNWTPSVTAWEGTEHTISHTADGAFDVEAPNLLVMKAVSAVSDPIEGTTRPKAMPGATMQYLVNVSNQGKGPADSNSLAITDPVPADSSFVVGSVVFTDGSTSSGLTMSAANVSYSNDNGATWTYTPVAGGDGTDPNVTNIKFSPQGSMAGKTGTAPSFNIAFKVIIK